MSLSEYVNGGANVGIRTYLSVNNKTAKLTVSYDNSVKSKKRIFEMPVQQFKAIKNIEVAAWHSECVLKVINR